MAPPVGSGGFPTAPAAIATRSQPRSARLSSVQAPPPNRLNKKRLSRGRSVRKRDPGGCRRSASRGVMSEDVVEIVAALAVEPGVRARPAGAWRRGVHRPVLRGDGGAGDGGAGCRPCGLAPGAGGAGARWRRSPARAGGGAVRRRRPSAFNRPHAGARFLPRADRGRRARRGDRVAGTERARPPPSRCTACPASATCRGWRRPALTARLLSQTVLSAG